MFYSVIMTFKFVSATKVIILFHIQIIMIVNFHFLCFYDSICDF
jgi:hypothetical protein